MYSVHYVRSLNVYLAIVYQLELSACVILLSCPACVRAGELASTTVLLDMLAQLATREDYT